MPILPEDFDAPPPPRAAPDKSVAVRKSALDKQARANQEREISFSAGRLGGTSSLRAIPLAIAAAVAALILFVSEKPVAKLVTNLLSKHIITDVRDPQALRRDLERKQAELELEKKRLADQQTALETQKREEAQAAERASEQAKEDELNRKKQLADAQIALEAQRRNEAQAAARARQEELNRNKQLADAQAALEKQKREEAQAAERASEQAQQEGLIRQQKLRELESLRAKEKEKEKEATAALYPSSGTLVWEGYVDGADLIDIQDGSPNHGNLSGALPGVPVGVQPFSSDRATTVTVFISPAPSNDWRRIALRIQAKGHTKVTVRWVRTTSRKE